MSEQNDDGILGNLPRSRPGVRSDKRASGKRSAGAGGAPGSPPAPKPRQAAPPPPPPSPPPERGADPIGLAVQTGETVARTGIKVATRVAGEVLRRIPRP